MSLASPRFSMCAAEASTTSPRFRPVWTSTVSLLSAGGGLSAVPEVPWRVRVVWECFLEEELATCTCWNYVSHIQNSLKYFLAFYLPVCGPTTALTWLLRATIIPLPSGSPSAFVNISQLLSIHRLIGMPCRCLCFLPSVHVPVLFPPESVRMPYHHLLHQSTSWSH